MQKELHHHQFWLLMGGYKTKYNKDLQDFKSYKLENRQNALSFFHQQ